MPWSRGWHIDVVFGGRNSTKRPFVSELVWHPQELLPNVDEALDAVHL